MAYKIKERNIQRYIASPFSDSKDFSVEKLDYNNVIQKEVDFMRNNYKAI